MLLTCNHTRTRANATLVNYDFELVSWKVVAVCFSAQYCVNSQRLRAHRCEFFLAHGYALPFPQCPSCQSASDIRPK
jgi:hypothetical protein